jgi:hypothetical protein
MRGGQAANKRKQQAVQLVPLGRWLAARQSLGECPPQRFRQVTSNVLKAQLNSYADRFDEHDKFGGTVPRRCIKKKRISSNSEFR